MSSPSLPPLDAGPRPTSLALRILMRFAIVLATALLVLGAPFVAVRAEGARPAPVRPGDMKSGALLLKGTEPGAYAEAPRVEADYDLTVSGPTIRTRVTQAFRNPTDGWVEGVYVYPLPEKGAVDTMKLVIGDRVIVADIKERAAAKATYERAKAEGRSAALVEQERPNLFTNSVANIGPGETVVVQIEYQAPVRQEAERMSLRVPLVVAPRYAPEPIAQEARIEGAGGWGVVDPVPDRARISPPVKDPRNGASANPVTITVRLNAGFPIGSLTSATHGVAVSDVAEDARTVTLSERNAPADRDFELSWTAKAGSTPAIGLFRERVGDASYVAAYVTPPAAEPHTGPLPRETIFVIDNSGSMGGPSMAQAKQSLLFALDRLTAADRFDVIRFDHTMERLFTDAVLATPDNVARARAFVNGLSARGGTEMLAPLKAALFDPRPNDTSHLRQIVFLTDGAIGDEQRMFDAIAAERGRSRLFMIGIGSAPNSYLMTRAAELGRGTFTHIGGVKEVDARMRDLFVKLENPVVTDLVARFENGPVDMTPATLPDLYRGESLVLAARIPEAEGALEVRGMIGDRPWTVTLDLAEAAPGAGISKLWARRKIDDAEVGRSLRELTPEAADAEVLKLALAHRLTTRLTSLVAVDRTPSRPAGERLTRAEMPLDLPAGWDFDKVFGAPADTGTPALREADAQSPIRSVATKDAAYPAAPQIGPQQGVTLPQTATDAGLRITIGLALALLAAGLLTLRPARRRA